MLSRGWLYVSVKKYLLSWIKRLNTINSSVVFGILIALALGTAVHGFLKNYFDEDNVRYRAMMHSERYIEAQKWALGKIGFIGMTILSAGRFVIPAFAWFRLM